MFATSVKPLNALLSNMNTPFLPKNRISSCIIGECYYNEINELTDLGINCITFPKNPKLDDEVSCHGDINVFNCGNGDIIAESNIAGELQRILTDYNVIPAGEIRSPYPEDICLNAYLDTKRLFCNSKYLNPQLKRFCDENNIEIIHTNQGYTKCSICAVSDNAVITEDDGLPSLLKICQYNVLKISKGFVGLSDRHYGFIGGATAKISDSELYVSGDVSAHPDYSLIKAFCDNYGVSLIFNKNRPLTDFGGLISII